MDSMLGGERGSRRRGGRLAAGSRNIFRCGALHALRGAVLCIFGVARMPVSRPLPRRAKKRTLVLVHTEGVAGSNPASPTIRGYSSVGRARDWQSRGQGFEPPYLHHEFVGGDFGRRLFLYGAQGANYLCRGLMVLWAAGSDPVVTDRDPCMQDHWQFASSPNTWRTSPHARARSMVGNTGILSLVIPRRSQGR